jgi:hypothetical protein
MLLFEIGRCEVAVASDDIVFKSQQFLELEDWTGKLSRNFGKKLLILAA